MNSKSYRKLLYGPLRGALLFCVVFTFLQATKSRAQATTPIQVPPTVHEAGFGSLTRGIRAVLERLRILRPSTAAPGGTIVEVEIINIRQVFPGSVRRLCDVRIGIIGKKIPLEQAQTILKPHFENLLRGMGIPVK